MKVSILLHGLTCVDARQVYLDLLAQEELAARHAESESDDTGSSISTVMERSALSSACSFHSETLGFPSDQSLDLAKVLGPFERDLLQAPDPLSDEENDALQPPENFQDLSEVADTPVLPPKPAPRTTSSSSSSSSSTPSPSSSPSKFRSGKKRPSD